MIIIDYLIDMYSGQHQDFNGTYYVAKPCFEQFGLRYFLTEELPTRIIDAWYILTGKCKAFYFYEDFPKKESYKGKYRNWERAKEWQKYITQYCSLV